jgi:hypothetical protein
MNGKELVPTFDGPGTLAICIQIIKGAMGTMIFIWEY